MARPVVPYARDDAILAVFVAAAGEVNGALVHLFKNNLVPDVNTLLADFEEADFTGYAASAAVTWSGPFRTPENEAKTVGDTKIFELTALPSQTVYGWYLTVGGALRASYRFEDPIPLAVVGNAAIVTPEYIVSLP